jgi:hypothetical protein
MSRKLTKAFILSVISGLARFLEVSKISQIDFCAIWENVRVPHFFSFNQ